MSKPITPEMIAAWRTLQEFAQTIRAEPLVGEKVRKAQEAVDVLDNSDFMVPIEEAEESVVRVPLSDLNGPSLARALTKRKGHRAEGQT